MRASRCTRPAGALRPGTEPVHVYKYICIFIFIFIYPVSYIYIFISISIYRGAGQRDVGTDPHELASQRALVHPNAHVSGRGPAQVKTGLGTSSCRRR